MKFYHGCYQATRKLGFNRILIKIFIKFLSFFSEVAEEEVDHLFVGADDDHDDRLGYDEIIANYDLFVGSEATDYGNHLNEDNLKHFKDEL